MVDLSKTVVESFGQFSIRFKGMSLALSMKAAMATEPHIAASQLITRRLEYVSPRSTFVVSIPKLQVEKARPRRYLIGRKRDQCWILPKHDIQRFHLMLYRNIRRETVTPESELDQDDDHESWRSHSSSHWGKERFSL
jgi:hypothetical protein